MTGTQPTPTPFPDGFLWGAATAGHQVEGGNRSSDMWAAELAPDSFFTEPSGDACDSYHRYAEDIGLLAAAGLNAYRLSIEWARIEPEEGWISRAELDHYRRMLAACHDRGVTPVLTYNHFTTPRWFAQRGGWNAHGAADRFARYCEQVTAHLGDLVEWACTLNEPNVMAAVAHIGIAPVGGGDETAAPGHRPLDAAEAERIAAIRSRSGHMIPASIPGFQNTSVDTMAEVHRRAVDAIGAGPGTQRIGWAIALIDLQPAPGGEERWQTARQAAQLDWLDVSRDDDFIGVQTYSRERIGPDGMEPRPSDAGHMLTGWEIYPAALEHTVRLAAERTGVPVLVTENGCATDDDATRIAYTSDALRGLARCIADGIDVRGYLHWTLLDNFEWVAGYAMTFGLVAVDRHTFARTPKPSLTWLGQIAQANQV